MQLAFVTAQLVGERVAQLFNPQLPTTPLADLLFDVAPKAPIEPKSDDELRAAFIAWLGPPPPKDAAQDQAEPETPPDG